MSKRPVRKLTSNFSDEFRTLFSGDADTLRNGVTTKKQDYTKPGSLTETVENTARRKTDAVKTDRGLHELWAWYDKCYVRERNKGQLQFLLNRYNSGFV